MIIFVLANQNKLYMMHIGQSTRISYEVYVYHMTKFGEDLLDTFHADNYKTGVKMAKDYSKMDGFTSAALVKYIEYYYDDRPDEIWDSFIDKRWEYRRGKLTATTDF